MTVRRPVLILLALVALVACSDSTPEVAPTTVPPETTTIPPRTTVTTVRATTTTIRPTTTVSTVLSIGPGEASLVGTVSGPAGPVDGATVRVERLVGKAVATTDVTTTGGGAWQLVSILGGSYRVRAFKSPDFVQSPVESFFLAANERRNLDFKLRAAGVERITAAVSPNPPRVDQGATLTITIGTERVDDQGRPSIAPRPGVVMTLGGGPGFVVESVPQVLTDSSGAASWRIRCTIEGANTVSLTIANGITQARIPSCTAAPAPAPTTTRPA